MSSTFIAENLIYTSNFSKIGTSKGTTLINNGTIFELLSVGADNTVLTADAAVSTGVKWEAPSTSCVVTVGIGGDYATIQEAINAVKEYAQSGNCIMIKIEDDHLVLEGDLITDVVLKSEAIIDRILEKI